MNYFYKYLKYKHKYLSYQNEGNTCCKLDTTNISDNTIQIQQTIYASTQDIAELTQDIRELTQMKAINVSQYDSKKLCTFYDTLISNINIYTYINNQILHDNIIISIKQKCLNIMWLCVVMLVNKYKKKAQFVSENFMETKKLYTRILNKYSLHNCHENKNLCEIINKKYQCLLCEMLRMVVVLVKYDVVIDRKYKEITGEYKCDDTPKCIINIDTKFNILNDSSDYCNNKNVNNLPEIKLAKSVNLLYETFDHKNENENNKWNLLAEQFDDNEFGLLKKPNDEQQNVLPVKQIDNNKIELSKKPNDEQQQNNNKTTQKRHISCIIL